MNDFFITLLSIFVSFFLGAGVLLFVGRGILLPYLKSKQGGFLLRVHSPDGVSAKFVVAKKNEAGLLEYKDGKEKRVVIPAEGSVVRCSKTWMMDVPEGDTGPYVWRKVIASEEEVEVEGGNKEKVTLYRQFLGYDDNKAIANALDWALMRPKRKIGGLGLDSKTIIILLVVVGAGLFLISQMASNGGGVI